MSPVLLDHRNLKWIWLSVGLLVALTFFGGYIMGFEKSNNKWLARLDPTEITLPDALLADLSVIEPQVPEVMEPGATIDVDSVDVSELKDADAIVYAHEAPAVTVVSQKVSLQPVVENSVDEAVVANTDPVVAVQSVPEPEEQVEDVVVQTSSVNEPEAESPVEADSIIDDASEESARYSIQVGMYKSFDNAAARVEELLNSNLSAYINDYKNKNDEIRYNVRFGFFSSFSGALKALKVYEQNYQGSGYVAKIKR